MTAMVINMYMIIVIYYVLSRAKLLLLVLGVFNLLCDWVICAMNFSSITLVGHWVGVTTPIIDWGLHNDE